MNNKQAEKTVYETIDKVYEIMQECWVDVSEQERPLGREDIWFNAGKFEDAVYHKIVKQNEK